MVFFLGALNGQILRSQAVPTCFNIADGESWTDSPFGERSANRRSGEVAAMKVKRIPTVTVLLCDVEGVIESRVVMPLSDVSDFISIEVERFDDETDDIVTMEHLIYQLVGQLGRSHPALDQNPSALYRRIEELPADCRPSPEPDC